MADKKTSSRTRSRGSKKAAPEVMVVNDSPGVECRIAILDDGHLDELYTEHVVSATNVGNIYKGRVTNIEPAIQAAFIDYGQGQSGFLHISDLHPRYFPGKERTEHVGRKIARRERPPIQQALKRGDEILVQVLKEGIGTKGPTLTSYLSIPGRLLVMMPDMDRVGVSRRVEDEDQRREMRKLLDDLNLPEDFGFILRTAGVGQSKTELKRDVAYLSRLWKVMEKRIKAVGAPSELYIESDLLLRTIRDVLRPSISAIVVDSESAYERVSMFLRVVAPRTTAKVVHYKRKAPIFHAFDIERQIELIHSREVPLKSGGKLVIDQTEALVAIDVNSGRSRSARDSETNALNTNLEAVAEICRQLRLRDLGGIIINDLIDMRMQRNRRKVEESMRDNLKRDRAKTLPLKISELGILEMTRQRMRPSLKMSHYMACPNCEGHGEIRSPDYVGADATRQMGHLLQYDRVSRVEAVCSPRVASVLLSNKRRELDRLEDESGKKIMVRVSEAIATDKVVFYAYDARNADIDLKNLPVLQPPTLADLEKDAKVSQVGETKKKRSRSRGRRTPQPADAAAIALMPPVEDEADESSTESAPKRGRRRRSRKKSSDTKAAEANSSGKQSSESEDPQGAKKTKKAGRRPARNRGKKGQTETQSLRIHQLATELNITSRAILDRCRTEGGIEVKNHMSTVTSEQIAQIKGWFDSREQEDSQKSQPTKRRRRGKRGGRRRRRGAQDAEIKGATDQSAQQDAEVSSPEPAVAVMKNDAEEGDGGASEKKRRTLYRSHRRVSASEAAALQDEE